MPELWKRPNHQKIKHQNTLLKAPREVRVVTDTGPLGYIWDTARFEHMYRIAEAMSWHRSFRIIFGADGSIKRNLRNSPRLKSKAIVSGSSTKRFDGDIDPFAIVDETYVTGGKLAYQGKVIAAIVNTRAPLKERIKYAYSGTRGKDDYTITVSGTFEGETEPREATLSVGQAKTQNQMWHKDPEQKLVYSGIIRWARRWTPDLILGVLTDDDIEREETWRAETAKQIEVATQRAAKPDWERLKGPAAAEAHISEAVAQEVVDQERKFKEASSASRAKDTLHAEFHR